MGLFAAKRRSTPYVGPVGIGGLPPTGTDPQPSDIAVGVRRPSAFASGGTGRAIAGSIGDALLGLAGQKPIYAPIMQDRRQQEADYQRQLALAQYKTTHPEPTAIQRNHDYFVSIGRPDLASSYLNAEANPQTLMTDPTTGAVGFYPKGGTPAVGSNMTPSQLTDDEAGYAAWNAAPSGSRFLDPQGKIRIKP